MHNLNFINSFFKILQKNKLKSRRPLDIFTLSWGDDFFLV